jgi:hypothetical protein
MKPKDVLSSSQERTAGGNACILEVVRFESRPGLSWLRIFVASPSPSLQMPEYYHQLGHDHFLSHFQFIIR